MISGWKKCRFRTFCFSRGRFGGPDGGGGNLELVVTKRTSKSEKFLGLAGFIVGLLRIFLALLNL